MKIFVILALVAFAGFSKAAKLGFGNKIECLQEQSLKQDRIFESTIREAIEKLRQQLKEGVPSLGIPPLDPLELNGKPIKLDNKFINLDLNATGRADGLLGFDITSLSVSLIGLKVKFTVIFPEVTAKGQYAVDALLPMLPDLHVFGHGNVDAKATNFVIVGNGKVTTKFINGSLKILIKELKVDLSLGDFKLDITGLMDDEELSKSISEYLTTNLPALLKQFNEQINNILKIVIDKINEIISGMLVADEHLTSVLTSC